MADQKNFNQLLLNSQLSADFELRVMKKIKDCRRKRRLIAALITLFISGGAALLSLKISHSTQEKKDYIAKVERSMQDNSRPKSYALEELHFVANSGEANYLYEEYYLKKTDQDQI